MIPYSHSFKMDLSAMMVLIKNLLIALLRLLVTERCTEFKGLSESSLKQFNKIFYWRRISTVVRDFQSLLQEELQHMPGLEKAVPQKKLLTPKKSRVSLLQALHQKYSKRDRSRNLSGMLWEARLNMLPQGYQDSLLISHLVYSVFHLSKATYT